ncbi:MAG: hypothetical protein LBR12_06245, partial [Opitutaceae bacterium]|nr:hypothetical protein [Opitutaceae bacterium]
FPWARWQETQAAVKLNVLFSVEEELPELCSIVTANEHDVNFLKTLTFAAGHYYVFDRGYPDFASWFRINQSGAGLFQPMIGFIETGTCVPTVATLFRIASVLGCPLAEIFGTVEAAIASGRRIPALGKRAKRR